jgi:hypothetical protein
MPGDEDDDTPLVEEPAVDDADDTDDGEDDDKE